MAEPPDGAAPPMANKSDPLPKRMREARIERGMTEAQLAERMHVRQAMISMVESGEELAGQDLTKRLNAWIDSGAGPVKKSPRGPYHKARSTIQGRE